MTHLFFATLRRKLLAVILVTTLVSLVVALCAMVAYDLRAYHQAWVSDIVTQADLLGHTSTPALEFDDARVARENLGLLRYRPQVRAAAIYNARGGLFASYSADRAEGFPKLPEADGARVEGGKLIVFKRIVENDEILGTVFLRAEYELISRLWSYTGIALTVALVAMGVAFLMSSRLQRIVTHPILAIGAIARDVVERRDYSQRAEKMSDDEVGVLVDAFNDMLSEIERRTQMIEQSNRNLEMEVAERRRNEEEVWRLNQELESRVRERTVQLEVANQELEAFCFSVSHDLRAPLRAIDGYRQALVEDCADNIPEDGQLYLQRIQSSVQRMGQLIEDLLNLSRVSRGVIDKRHVDLGELALQVIAELRQRDPARIVEVSVWDGLGVEADPRLLRVVLENLLGNAWKFTSKTATPRIEVGALRDSESMTYFVRDNGSGFDMAYADKLFGAFQRLHAVTDFPGTGIGLATVQRIVHRHGGRIWADAKVGKGAIFFFTLENRDLAAPDHSGSEVAT